MITQRGRAIWDRGSKTYSALLIQRKVATSHRLYKATSKLGQIIRNHIGNLDKYFQENYTHMVTSPSGPGNPPHTEKLCRQPRS